MPRRQPSPCSEHGCPALTDHRTGYCPAHVPPSHTRTTASRGLGALHQRIRKQVLREETHCHLCGAPVDLSLPGTDPWGPTADHIQQRQHGGRNVRENYRLAHNRCQSGRH